jgi:hypothetical protein
VPSLPGLSSGYAHVTPDYFITTLSGITPTAADIDVQNDGINNQNPAGSSYTIEDQAHDFYFNNISICYPASSTIPFSTLSSTLEG